MARPRPRLLLQDQDQDFASRSRPRPRLFFRSSRRLETKTWVSRTTSLVSGQHVHGNAILPLLRVNEPIQYSRQSDNIIQVKVYTKEVFMHVHPTAETVLDRLWRIYMFNATKGRNTVRRKVIFCRNFTRKWIRFFESRCISNLRF
jgi:hypothetical protein